MLGIVVILAALGGWSAAALAQAQKLKVVFPAVSETLYLPFLIAQDKGWMNAEAVQVSGDANAMRALLSGTADVAIVGDFNVFSASAEHAAIRVIGSWQGVNDYQMVVDKSINSFQDLAGKVYATTGPGAPPEEFSKLVLKKHGVDLSKVQFIAIGGGGHATLLQAVLAGRAAGTLVTTSNAMQGDKSGKVKVLTSVAREFPDLGYVYSVVRKEELDDPVKRVALQQFATGSIQASRYIEAHPDDAAKFAVQRYPASDPAVLTKTVLALAQAKVWGVNGGIESQQVTGTLRIARETGLLKHDIAPSELFDTQFVDAAMAKLGPMK
jgi:ABC-type nitrate/sulfonate/bicarbonate transport system substrate-binding protein